MRAARSVGNNFRLKGCEPVHGVDAGARRAVSLYRCYLIQRRIPLLRKSPVFREPLSVGCSSLCSCSALRARGTLGITLDTSLRAPLQTVFFTTIGLSATPRVIERRVGGAWASSGCLPSVHRHCAERRRDGLGERGGSALAARRYLRFVDADGRSCDGAGARRAILKRSASRARAR